MESINNNIFLILIAGIPAIGKSYFANKIISEFSKKYDDIKYLNFDKSENINQENYLQFKQMRNDYITKIDQLLMDIGYSNKSLLIILDDNFFLKSMRKKIYNLFMDKIIQYSNNTQNTSVNFYYLELLFKPLNINYCLNLNSLRKDSEKIPEKIIINMNNVFEYNSPYIDKSKCLIIDISSKEDMTNFDIDSINKNMKNYLIKIKQEKKNDNKQIINIKNNKSVLIDEIENIIRKNINILLKNDDTMKKNGKKISLYKKEYMKNISNFIKNIDKENIEDDTKFDNNIKILIKECLMKDEIQQIKENKNLENIIISDFQNYLKKL